MKLPFKLSGKSWKAVLVAVLLLGLVLLFVKWPFDKAWRPWFIGLIVVLILLWVAIDWLVKSLRRRKQARFDAGVAAREGIDDRKREWATWTAEMRKRGIDRYELPFYLLVGEPQSGKSILLQNSDLHFPFGQNRLSGVGGTRGCDWWFTEEAVILDLAGRLFTHEGGAADEAEWEAFLQLLADFRPLSPANGILLVLPCDRMLEDTPEQTTKKANRIQGALLTLTSKLQARLPVYVVLTKADKVFGFVESVHRLEAEKRHQMFGWSRPPERFDAPFELEEARQGFLELVHRAAVLRADMLVTERIPEGLNSVDRMYAFPRELAVLEPALVSYLQRVFSESSLGDKLFFRGIYLTSGLQTGAPVAKACAEVFAGAREADAKALDQIFTKQRAFFIKDLIRKRVFGERGLVRPTKRRLTQARKQTLLGYGAAGALLAIAVAVDVGYLLTADESAEAEKALAIVEDYTKHGRPPNQERSLEALEALWMGWARETSEMELAFKRLTNGLKELYATILEIDLAPAVRQEAVDRIKERAQLASVGSGMEFEQLVENVQFILGEIEPGVQASGSASEETQWELLVDLAGLTHLATRRSTVPDKEREGGFTLRSAIDSLGSDGTPDFVLASLSSVGPDAKVRRELAEAFQPMWNGRLDPLQPWKLNEPPLGFVLAGSGLKSLYGKLGELSRLPLVTKLDALKIAQVARAYVESIASIEPTFAEPTTIDEREAVEQATALCDEAASFYKLLGASAPAPSLKEVEQTIKSFFTEGSAASKGAIGQRRMEFPPKRLADYKDKYPSVSEVLSAQLSLTGGQIAGDLARVMEQDWGKFSKESSQKTIYLARARLQAEQFILDFQTVEALDPGFGDKGKEAQQETIQDIANLRRILAGLSSRTDLFKSWTAHLDGLAEKGLEEMEGVIMQAHSDPGERSLDGNDLGFLVRVEQHLGSVGQHQANAMRTALVSGFEGDIRERWLDAGREEQSLDRMNAMRTVVLRAQDLQAALVLAGSSLDPDPRLHESPEHKAFMSELQDQLSTLFRELADWNRKVVLPDIPEEASFEDTARIVLAKVQATGSAAPDSHVNSDEVVLPGGDDEVFSNKNPFFQVQGMEIARESLKSWIGPDRDPGVLNPETSDFVDWLDSIARPILEHRVNVSSGPALAEHLVKTHQKIPSIPDISDVKLNACHGALMKSFVAEIHARLRADIVQMREVRFADLFANFEGAAFDTDGAYRGPSGTPGKAGEQANAYFKPSGALDKLWSDYKLDDPIVAANVLPVSQASERAKETIAYLNFLRELQGFLQQKEKDKDGKERYVDLAITKLVLAPPDDVSNTIWSGMIEGRRVMWLFVRPDPDGKNTLKNYEASKKEDCLVGWKYMSNPEALEVRWHFSVRAERAVGYVFSGFLAPLRVAWSGTADEGRTKWLVEGNVDGQRAPFYVKLEKPLPARPEPLRK